MEKTCCYNSPIGRIILKSEGNYITELYFSEDEPCGEAEGVLREGMRWLEIYFSGKEPDFLPPLAPSGTSFGKLILKLILEIPYGRTSTYGEIAKKAAERLGKKRMSAQAVGGAAGRNPIGLMIPCHRVIGSDGSMTGYALGIERKIFLLELEKNPEKCRQADKKEL